MYGIGSDGIEFLYDENFVPETFVDYKGEKVLVGDEFAADKVDEIRKIYKKNGKNFDKELKLLQFEFTSCCHVEENNKILAYSTDYPNLPNITLRAPAKKIGEKVRFTDFGGLYEREHHMFEITCNNKTKDYTVAHYDFSEEKDKVEKYTAKNFFLATAIFKDLATRDNDLEQKPDLFWEDKIDYKNGLSEQLGDLKTFNLEEDREDFYLWDLGVIPHVTEKTFHNSSDAEITDYNITMEKDLHLLYSNPSKKLETHFFPSAGRDKEFEHSNISDYPVWRIKVIKDNNVLSTFESRNAFLAAQEFIDQIGKQNGAKTKDFLMLADGIGELLNYSIKVLMEDANPIHMKTIFEPQLNEALSVAPEEYSSFFKRIYERALSPKSLEKTNTNDFRRD